MRGGWIGVGPQAEPTLNIGQRAESRTKPRCGQTQCHSSCRGGSTLCPGRFTEGGWQELGPRKSPQSPQAEGRGWRVGSWICVDIVSPRKSVVIFHISDIVPCFYVF